VKKAILILGALLMVVSGVAAVSAYEAHIINIKAHVENALIVPNEQGFGTVFPQETVNATVCLALSDSFRDVTQTRVSDITYVIYWEPKEIPQDLIGIVCDPEGDYIYEPLAPWVTIIPPTGGNDGLGDPGGSPGAVAYGALDKSGGDPDLYDCWTLEMKAPVFEEWYNPTTDPDPNPNILPIGKYCVVVENIDSGIFDPDIGSNIIVSGKVPHADLGSDFKIQVTGFSYHLGPSGP
jgi:hypothetical protein